MFKLTKIDLGHVKAKKKIILEYPYENISTIVKIMSPCDCSVPKNDVGNSKLVVEYIPKAVPEHIKQDGKTVYQVDKEINIIFKTNDNPSEEKTEKLRFTAKISD